MFDLSGAFREWRRLLYEKYYGFTHQHPELLEQRVYGPAEWCADKLKEADPIAVPGCYPTAAQLALKPLIDAGLLIWASGRWSTPPAAWSGAGRKAAISTALWSWACSRMASLITSPSPRIATHLLVLTLSSPLHWAISAWDPKPLPSPETRCDRAQGRTRPSSRRMPMETRWCALWPTFWRWKMSLGCCFAISAFAVQGEHLIVVATRRQLTERRCRTGGSVQIFVSALLKRSLLFKVRWWTH